MTTGLQTEIGKLLAQELNWADGGPRVMHEWAMECHDRMIIEAHTEEAYKTHQIGAHFGDALVFKNFAAALEPFMEMVG